MAVGEMEKISGTRAWRGMAFLLGLFALSLFATAQSTADDEHNHAAPVVIPTWDSATLDAFARWPIQDQGRVKPLSTFARFKLVKLSGRTSIKTPDDRRLESLAWLLETMLYPDLARDYKVVRIENPAVMQAIGLSDAVKRTNFSFNDLLSHDDALTKAAQQAFETPEKNRDLVQQQVLNLYDNYMDLAKLVHALEFGRYHLHDAEAAQVRGWIGLQGDAPLDFATLVPASVLLMKQFGQSHDSQQSTQTLMSAQQVLTELDQLASLSTALAVFPPLSKPDTQEWFSAGSLFREVVTGKNVLPKPELDLLREVQSITQVTGAPALLLQKAQLLAEKLRAAAGDRIEPWRLDLEIFFYKMKFFQYGLVLFILSFICVACSWLTTRGSKLEVMLGKILPWMVSVPTLLMVAGITIRCIIRGRPPVSTLYETTLFVPAVAIVVALVAEWINRKRIALAAAAILGVIGLFMANSFELKDGNDTMTSLVAVLNSNFWLATHVTTVSIGYSAGLLAAGIAHIYIFAKLLNLKKNEPAFYKNIARMTYGVVCFGALFSFVGTVLGGIWANYSWGRFWGWDPKENGALAIILWNLIILHSRMGGYIRDLGLCLLAIFGGIIVSASWWGVNLLGVGLHSYGFTSGIMKWLFGYWIFELIVIAIGGLIASRTSQGNEAPPPPGKSQRHSLQPGVGA
jgi:ABC-type transport system involved in cytochrome c biogenesis permease subunit